MTKADDSAPTCLGNIVPSPQVRILKTLIDQMNDIFKFVRDLKSAFLTQTRDYSKKRGKLTIVIFCWCAFFCRCAIFCSCSIILLKAISTYDFHIQFNRSKIKQLMYFFCSCALDLKLCIFCSFFPLLSKALTQGYFASFFLWDPVGVYIVMVGIDAIEIASDAILIAPRQSTDHIQLDRLQLEG